MKKYLILPIVFTLLLSSCNKELQGENDNVKTEFQLKSISKLANMLDKEGKQVYSAFFDYDHILTVIDHANHGKSLPANQNMVNALAGKATDNLEVYLNEKKYTSNSDGGHFTYKNENFREYFGKEISLKIKENSDEKTYKIYVPKSIKVSNLVSEQKPQISKSGNKMRWSVDEKTPGNHILVHFKSHEKATMKVKRSIVRLIPNTGEFILDELIELGDELVSVKFYSGNAISHEMQNGDKLNFNFRSVDYHLYSIKTD
ncbi:MAG: hypothetical protein N4A45_11240 [Flavobacteriales bacterium]|jgi:hypothetical protein|nr:hypothetical protein [Flavobacteriales bacterium]